MTTFEAIKSTLADAEARLIVSGHALSNIEPDEDGGADDWAHSEAERRVRSAINLVRDAIENLNGIGEQS